jgi:hypothetical protein
MLPSAWGVRQVDARDGCLTYWNKDFSHKTNANITIMNQK